MLFKEIINTLADTGGGLTDYSKALSHFEQPLVFFQMCSVVFSVIICG